MTKHNNYKADMAAVSKSLKLTKIIQPEYERLFGFVDRDKGYSLKTIQTKNNDYLVILYYSRNDYHSEEERKVLFCKDGRVIENNKQVNTWNHLTTKN